MVQCPHFSHTLCRPTPSNAPWNKRTIVREAQSHSTPASVCVSVFDKMYGLYIRWDDINIYVKQTYVHTLTNSNGRVLIFNQMRRIWHYKYTIYSRVEIGIIISIIIGTSTTNQKNYIIKDPKLQRHCYGYFPAQIAQIQRVLPTLIIWGYGVKL